MQDRVVIFGSRYGFLARPIERWPTLVAMATKLETK